MHMMAERSNEKPILQWSQKKSLNVGFILFVICLYTTVAVGLSPPELEKTKVENEQLSFMVALR